MKTIRVKYEIGGAGFRKTECKMMNDGTRVGSIRFGECSLFCSIDDEEHIVECRAMERCEDQGLR